MAKNITTGHLIKNLLPDHVVANYPRLIVFLESFFKYLETQNKSSYYQNTLYFQRDIYEQDPEFFEYITRELGALSGGRFETDSKVLYDQIVKIWQSKGTEESLIFLLKAIYGADENTKITYPRDFILRASDAVWNQERFVTVFKSFGAIPETVDSVILVNNNIEQVIEISRIEIIDPDTTRFYFTTNNLLNFDLGQIIKIVSNDLIIYQGEIILSPLSIAVNNGGKDWQIGQVISFPGTTKDTLARVAEVTNIGEIKRVEIIDYGYSNDVNETFIISPYPVKPTGTVFDYEYDNETNTHTLSIFDSTSGTIENVVGLSSGVSPDSYFLENYTSEIYSSTKVINIITKDLSQEEAPDTSSPITLEEWLESRATLRYIFGNQTKIKGSWKNNKGIISDNSIKLQDNLYYQQFSYDIETNKLRTEYKTLLDIVHVAGTKSFSTTSFEQALNLNISLATEVPFKWIYLDDVVNTEDQDSKIITLDKSDNFALSDERTLSYIKSNTETLTSSDSITDFDITKNLLEEPNADDSVFNKLLSRNLENDVTALQYDIATFYNEENYFDADYAVDGDAASLESTLS